MSWWNIILIWLIFNFVKSTYDLIIDSITINLIRNQYVEFCDLNIGLITSIWINNWLILLILEIIGIKVNYKLYMQVHQIVHACKSASSFLLELISINFIFACIFSSALMC